MTEFVLELAALDLEAGARIDPHRVQGWTFGPDDGPVVLCVHALTGDAQVGGENGWWAPLIGPGRAFDTTRFRVVCFNNLGSCYGTSGPRGARNEDTRYPAPAPAGKGALRQDERALPPTITTWDQARSLLMALDALDVGRVHLATGGSLGAMIVLCLAVLAPERFDRLAPVAGMSAASPWIIGWNHIARQALLADPERGFELARQLAMLTYRAEPGLAARHGRTMAADTRFDGAWSSRTGYRAQTYLEHQGQKLRERFTARAYLHQLDAMDHHDLYRRPPGASADTPWDPLAQYRASTLAIGIDTDMLYDPDHMRRLAADLAQRGLNAEYAEIESPHGHDAFLIEWDQLEVLMRRALALPEPRA